MKKQTKPKFNFKIKDSRFLKEKKNYHGTSFSTSGLLKVFAAAHLLFVGIGSPAGV